MEVVNGNDDAGGDDADGGDGGRPLHDTVLRDEAGLVGALPWSAVLEGRERPGTTVGSAMITDVHVAYPDEILRSIADRMAHEGLGAMPVVARADNTRLVGLITQFDLLDARQNLLEEERHAERVLTLRGGVGVGVPGGAGPAGRGGSPNGSSPAPLRVESLDDVTPRERGG